jgi:hypothetical protein
MRNTLPAAIIIGLFFTGCMDSNSSLENISFDSSIVTNNKPGNINNALSDTSIVQPVQNKLQSLPAATSAQTNAATAPGMNPPHGQPGHRCDIAVGAPLNSVPAKTSGNTSQATTAQAVTTTAPIKTAPGMNPPHGQPGHRCDIAVGAPLNSAPVKAITSKTDSIKKTSEAVPKNTATTNILDSAKKQ